MARKGRTRKKANDQLKPKAAEPRPQVKGPVDVEKQCGVPLSHGQPCGRSLCCKRHSMNAKRAVPGRSLPYDMLLEAYREKRDLEKKKQEEAAMDGDANVPAPAPAPLGDGDEADLVAAAQA